MTSHRPGNPADGGLNADEVAEIVALFETTDWLELDVTVGETALRLRRDERAGSETTADVRSGGAADSSPATVKAAEHGHLVTAPSLGIFWRSPHPGAPPFVSLGDLVAADTTVGILEVMKLMTPLKADSSGVVAAILVEDGAPVARGDGLVRLVPGPEEATERG